MTISTGAVPKIAARRAPWFAPTLRIYRFTWLRGDVLGGLAAGTVVVPQAMAYATIAGLPVQVGLYTCMAPMIGYALLGGGRAVSVSTTSTIAVLVATTLASLPNSSGRSVDQLVAAASTLTFMVGVALLLLRLLKLGGLVEIISPATLTGVRVGVGLTVAASQLPALFGYTADPNADGFFARIGDAVAKLPTANLVTVLVAAGSVMTMLMLNRLAPRIPAQLVVVAAGIVLVATTTIADPHGGGLTLIDHIPAGLPSPQLPVPDDVLPLLPGSLAIAVMAFLETVLVARTNRRPGEPAITVDQELLANGIAAMAGGLSQALPPAGGFSQSAVNLRSGARTQAAGLVTAGLAVVVALFLGPVLDNLPRAILAAMVLVAILGLLNPADFFRYARIDRVELWVALAVALLGLTGGMLLGVAAGIALTLALVVRSVNQPRVRPVYARATGGWTTNPPADGQAVATESGILLLHLDGALYAGNVQTTLETIHQTVESGNAQLVVLECAAVHGVTIPMVDGLKELATSLDRADVTMVISSLPKDTLALLARSRWFAGRQKLGLVTATIDDAIERFHQSNSEQTRSGGQPSS